MSMPQIPVAIPLLLGNATGGAREVTVTGATLQACLDDLIHQFPLLRTHLYEENGAIRKHVLILHNDQNIRWFEDFNQPTTPSDSITILQAVSGG